MAEVAAMPSAQAFLSQVQRPAGLVLSPLLPLPPAGIAEAQRAFFRRGLTREVGFRVKQLEVLRGAIVQREADVLKALKRGEAGDVDRPEHQVPAL
jgi:hypothetical protein